MVIDDFEPHHGKTCLRSFKPGLTDDTNQAVQPQNMARGFKFRISEVVGLYNAKTKALDLRLCFSHMQKQVFS